MELELKLVPMAQIKESDVALRPAERESEDYQGLVATIRERGFQGSIALNKNDSDDFYTIIDGAQRFNAARDAGLTEIPATIQKNKSKVDMLLDQITMNNHRVETKPHQYAQGLKRILAAEPTLTKGELAKRLSVSTAFIDGRLKLTTVAPEIGALIDDGTIKLANAIALSNLPPEEQKSFIADATNDDVASFTSKVGARKKEIAEARKAGGEAKPAGFQLIAKWRNRSEVEAAIAAPKPLLDLINTAGDGSASDTITLVLKWILQIDPISEEARKAEWEADQAAKAKAREEAKAKKEAEAKDKANAAEAAVSV